MGFNLQSMVTGWWYTYPSEKYARQLISWDYSSQYIWKNKSHVPNHQSEVTFTWRMVIMVKIHWS